MSNLKLVPDAPTPLEKLLLEASRAEQPSDEHKARLRAALGLGLPLSSPLGAPPPAPPASPNVVARAAGKSLTAAKAAVGVGAIALVAALWLTQRQEPVASLPAAPKAPAAVVTPPAVAAAEEEHIAVSPLPPVEETTTETPRAARSGVVVPSPSADLSEQIRLIEAARAGLASRSAGSALAALDSYAAKYPRGAFGQEAMVLRIRALEQAGDSARATALAKSFIARFPTSPHVARLKPIAERGASR